MSGYRFDGRVAIVTGAGRGLGRAHARLLAARGAKVVVNDLGGAMDGSGTDAGPAQDAVAEFTAAGGTAVADGNDVSTTEGARGVVDTALREFGTVDVVVNNAGIVRWGGLPDVTPEDFRATLDVHVVGAYNVVRAAWPVLAEKGYGRIVSTTSTGLFGLPDNFSYATAKAALIGMTNVLRINGAELGITANLIAPAALTRMQGGSLSGGSAPREVTPEMHPDLVAPVVAWLAHEECTTSGEIYAAGAGRVSRIVLASNDGWLDPSDATIEGVARNWAQINDMSEHYVPDSLLGWSRSFMKHLAPASS